MKANYLLNCCGKIHVTAILTLAILLSAALAAPAATISWTATPFVNGGDGFKSYTGTNQFAVDGILIAARNYGAGGASGTTLVSGGMDGSDIDFLADGDAPLGWSNAPDAYHSTLATMVSAGGAYNVATGPKSLIMGSGFVPPGETGRLIGDVTFVPGEQYRVQYLIYDGRDVGTLGGSEIVVDGVNYGSFATGTFGVSWGDGLLLTGIFTADNTYQEFEVEIIRNDLSSGGGQINALMVHQLIPEPSTWAMLGIGALGLATFHIRRKRRSAHCA